MVDLQLELTEEEQAHLVELLESALKRTRIEEHRTRSPTYREHVSRHTEVLVAILNKLGQPT